MCLCVCVYVCVYACVFCANMCFFLATATQLFFCYCCTPPGSFDVAVVVVVFVCLFVCLFVYLFICLFVCVCVCFKHFFFGLSDSDPTLYERFGEKQSGNQAVTLVVVKYDPRDAAPKWTIFPGKSLVSTIFFSFYFTPYCM